MKAIKALLQGAAGLALLVVAVAIKRRGRG
jgi:hypothetical protein